MAAMQLEHYTNVTALRCQHTRPHARAHPLLHNSCGRRAGQTEHFLSVLWFLVSGFLGLRRKMGQEDPLLPTLAIGLAGAELESRLFLTYKTWMFVFFWPVCFLVPCQLVS